MADLGERGPGGEPVRRQFQGLFEEIAGGGEIPRAAQHGGVAVAPVRQRIAGGLEVVDGSGHRASRNRTPAGNQYPGPR